MKELPILFSSPMTAAILDGRKSMTRRIVKPQPDDHNFIGMQGFGDIAFFHNPNSGDNWHISAKYQPDTILYVRESHYRFGRWVANQFSKKTGKQKWKFVATTNEVLFNAPEKYLSSPAGLNDKSVARWYKRNSLFMPKSAARIWLQVTGVKVERVQDISEQDAIAEGIETNTDGFYRDYSGNHKRLMMAKQSFQTLWAKINGKESWEANPWVFCFDFKVISTKGKPTNI